MQDSATFASHLSAILLPLGQAGSWAASGATKDSNRWVWSPKLRSQNIEVLDLKSHIEHIGSLMVHFGGDMDSGF